ncbi:hypothetical protein KI387_001161, partial [Taxus chinensis]
MMEQDAQMRYKRWEESCQDAQEKLVAHPAVWMGLSEADRYGSELVWRQTEMSLNLSGGHNMSKTLMLTVQNPTFCCRDFIRSNYKDLKTLNPRFPILIRECSGIEPRIWARY